MEDTNSFLCNNAYSAEPVFPQRDLVVSAHPWAGWCPRRLALCYHPLCPDSFGADALTRRWASIAARCFL